MLLAFSRFGSFILFPLGIQCPIETACFRLFQPLFPITLKASATFFLSSSSFVAEALMAASVVPVDPNPDAFVALDVVPPATPPAPAAPPAPVAVVGGVQAAPALQAEVL